MSEVDINEIPEGWEDGIIDNICDVKGGKRLPKGHNLLAERNNHPYIRVTDMLNGSVNLRNILYVPKEVQNTIKNYTVSSDDLFISVAGTIGMISKVPKVLNGANLTENADKLTNISINKDYLFYSLNSDVIKEQINNCQTLGAQPKLAINTIKNLRIIIPPLPEQKNIASILSSVDEAIQSTQKVIDQTQKVKQGLLQELLTKGIDHTEFKKAKLGKIPSEWTVCKLENCSDFITKGTTPTTYGYSWETEGILFLRSECVSANGFSLVGSNFISDEANEALGRSKIIGGDLLITITGNIGRVCQYPIGSQQANINQHIARIRINNLKVLPDFILYLLSSKRYNEYFHRIVTGLAYAQISLHQIRNTEIHLPKLEEQKQIASILSSVYNSIQKEKQKKEQLIRVKKGLMQDLLTGKVRVKVS